jgi:hypothetical protein
MAKRVKITDGEHTFEFIPYLPGTEIEPGQGVPEIPEGGYYPDRERADKAEGADEEYEKAGDVGIMLYGTNKPFFMPWPLSRWSEPEIVRPDEGG